MDRTDWFARDAMFVRFRLRCGMDVAAAGLELNLTPIFPYAMLVQVCE